MSSHPNDEWQETKVILHELEQLFTREDDIQDVMDVNQMEKEIDMLTSARLKDAKDIIKGKVYYISEILGIILN